MEHAVMEILGQVFTRHKSAEPLCFIVVNNFSYRVRDAVKIQHSVCYWPVPEHGHVINDSGFASFPFLFPNAIHIFWPWRASGPAALLSLPLLSLGAPQSGSIIKQGV